MYYNPMDVINAVRYAKNPQAMLEQYARTNKNVREVMDMVDQCGDPKTAFYKLASAKGVDPDAILSMIRK